MNLSQPKFWWTKKSPFLKSVILNKGFNSGLKKGMPVLDGPYFVGRITEVNYLSSRALLINDLNSKISVLIEPMGYQAIMSGTGDKPALLEFLPKNHQLESWWPGLYFWHRWYIFSGYSNWASRN